MQRMFLTISTKDRRYHPECQRDDLTKMAQPGQVNEKSVICRLVLAQ